MAETALNKLALKRAKKSTLETLTVYDDNAIYFVDPQFDGDKFLKTTESGDIIEADIVVSELATKTELEDKADKSTTYTKDEIDEMIGTTIGDALDAINGEVL